MLDDDEYTRLRRLMGPGAMGDTREQRFVPVLQEYERITGFRETNTNALFHHQLSLYGPPCVNCGKPLRSPQAKLCAACITPVVKQDPTASLIFKGKRRRAKTVPTSYVPYRNTESNAPLLPPADASQQD
jgi:hypothetical protein